MDGIGGFSSMYDVCGEMYAGRMVCRLLRIESELSCCLTCAQRLTVSCVAMTCCMSPSFALAVAVRSLDVYVTYGLAWYYACVYSQLQWVVDVFSLTFRISRPWFSFISGRDLYVRKRGNCRVVCSGLIVLRRVCALWDRQLISDNVSFMYVICEAKNESMKCKTSVKSCVLWWNAFPQNWSGVQINILLRFYYQFLFASVLRRITYMLQLAACWRTIETISAWGCYSF